MTTLIVNPVKGSNIRNPLSVPRGLCTLKDGERLKPGHHCMRIMTAEDGDKRVVWDGTDLRQIAEARRMFQACIREGLVPYKVGTDGKATAEVMDEFDPAVEEVIFLPITRVAAG